MTGIDLRHGRRRAGKPAMMKGRFLYNVAIWADFPKDGPRVICGVNDDDIEYWFWTAVRLFGRPAYRIRIARRCSEAAA